MIFFKSFLVFILLLTTSGCEKGDNSATKSSQEKSDFLRISFQTEVRSLDPRVGIDYPSTFATKMLFEGLMRIGPNGIAEPAIAKSYTLSNDHKTYIFKLRDARWSNGDIITAHDFAYTWMKVIDPRQGESLGVQNFYPIKNTRAIIRGDKPIETLGIEVLDDFTLKIELEHPTPYFLDVLATSSLFPVNSRIDQENPKWATQGGDSFVSNGPFNLDSHKIDNEIVVVKNPSYWDQKHVKLPGIHIAIIKDPNTQSNLFEKKQLEWLGKPLSKLPVEALESLTSKDKIRFFETLGVYWFFVNVEAFPFHNKKMRKAFSYAVDRKSLTKYITQGKESPAMGVLPYSLASQKKPFFEDNNITLACQLFKEALEEMEIPVKNFPSITVNYADTPVHQQVAEVLQQQWSKAFGIDIKLEKQEWKAHYEKLQKGNYQIGGMAWQSWLRDPIYIMQTFRDKSDSVNMSQWENQKFQNLLISAEQEIFPDKRKLFFNKAEALLMDEMPVIPIYFTTIAYAKSNRLKNVYVSELFEVDFRWSYFKETP